MSQFFHTLLDNIVFLIVLLPMVGAGLILAVSRFDKESIRKTALTNVAITLLLAVLMVSNYDIQNDVQAGTNRSRENSPQQTSLQIQMQSSFRWLGKKETHETTDGGTVNSTIGPNVRLAVGVDGISIWLIFSTVVLSFSCVLANWETQPERPATFFALLLLTEAGLIGVFAALDVVLFYLFIEFTLLPMFLLIGWWGGYARREVARRLLLSNLVGSLLILLGLMSIVLTYVWMRTTESNPHPSMEFSISRLIDGIRYLVDRDETSAHIWSQMSPWIFLSLVFGFAIKISLFPFHRWLRDACSEGPPVAAVLSIGLFTAIGGYGLLRLVLVLFPQMCFLTTGVISALAISGTIIVLLIALTETDIRKRLVCCCLGQLGLSVAGIFTLNEVGVTGGLLQFLSLAPAAAILFLLTGFRDPNRKMTRVESARKSKVKFPVVGPLLGLAAFSLIGMPGLGGFPAKMMLVLGVFRGNAANVPWASMFALWMLVALLLLAWVMLLLIRDVFQQPTATNLTPVELTAFIPLVTMILWIGLWPQFFLDRIQPTIFTILTAYRNF